MVMKRDKRHQVEELEPRKEDSRKTYLKESKWEGVKCMILVQSREK
jgi:hypothetical protein